MYDVVVLPNRSVMLTLTLSLIWWLFNTVVLPRRKKSSRSLSHLLMSFLSFKIGMHTFPGISGHATAMLETTSYCFL